MNYYTLDEKGGLEESLATLKPIEEWTFNKLIQSGIYKHYAYDERIKSTRYILRRISNNYGLPAYIIRCEGNPYRYYLNSKGIYLIEIP